MIFVKQLNRDKKDE